MARVTYIQNSFNTGELSPRLYGRADAERYKSALKTTTNFISLLQGPLTKRPGTEFIGTVKLGNTNGDGAIRLIPFNYSSTQTYVIELGSKYARFYRNGSLIFRDTQDNSTNARTITTIVTGVRTAVYTSNATGPQSTYSDRVFITGIVGTDELNNREFRILGSAGSIGGHAGFYIGDALTGIDIDSSTYGSYSSGGTAGEIYEIAHPYATDDLTTVRTTQSADTLYLVHPSYSPVIIGRLADNSWSVNTSPTFLDGPYLNTNTTATTLAPSATTGNINITSSTAMWVSTDIGRLVRIQHSSTWGYARITGITSTTVATATVVNAFGATTAVTTWRLGLYSDTTGWPSYVGFHQNRLFFGGSAAGTQRLDGSNSGDYLNFAPTSTSGTVADSNALAYTLNSDDSQTIRWFKSTERGLAVGTTSGEWLISPSSLNDALTPTNVTARQATSYGSATVNPTLAGKAVLFVTPSGQKVRELLYTFNQDGFVSSDLLELSDHLALPSLRELTFQQEPNSIVWASRSDGVLLSSSYDRGPEALRVGWNKHVIGGYSDVGKTQSAIVGSLCTINDPTINQNRTYLTVRRVINGQTVRHIERFSKFFDSSVTKNDATFLDSSLSYSGTAKTDFSGLWHLEGQEVSTYLDGAPSRTYTVVNGKISLDIAASNVRVGYAYTSTAQILRIEAGSEDGSSFGKIRRTNNVSVLVDRTQGLEVGGTLNSLFPLVTRYTGLALDQAPDLYSGNITTNEFNADNDYNNEWFIVHSQPLPATILSIVTEFTVQDR